MPSSTGQPSLFATGDVALFDDAEGGIRYRPGLIDVDTASRLFHALLQNVEWRALQREMYERTVDVPRLIASYPLDAPALPSAVGEILQVVQQVVDAPFDSVGINLYRDGGDSVAPHSDTLHALMPRQPIALVSLGDVRDMVITPKPGIRGRRIRLPLEPGSLLLMSHASQSTHDHGIPKTREAVGPRISLAFRVRQPGGDLLRGYRPAG
ncbi:alpha-ketoglutarate-dependent dioxygenase AlkB [Lysobacter sp. TY2-98]|uniref:alpha-ketoglutarate-dependent dioxygenase AlkB family protein n=1 Tax=Lysobacter sp. TY2-98 TaxID=2290922 RepID=UPI000E207FA8|nr:alpha-ketoglutarate-dependent dioxygenase AlkB [Lysobacter sp. TY2-98]AXK72051.1 alpha-ketoglutarate-dependent dioxygenase AlkB [Lysobacter sp. TY2-98]